MTMVEDSTILVIVSADSEWQIATQYYPDCELRNSTYNSWFEQKINQKKVIFFHGGWGKISAAATAQYAIDRWQPDVVLNLGTCGGVAGAINIGDVVLATETLIYDIYERMGDAQSALDFYKSQIDLSWLGEKLPIDVHKTRLISADRDIDPAEVTQIMDRFQAYAADWESGAIAWVAAKYNRKCLILRGVSDAVDSTDGEAYGKFDLFADRTKTVMTHLLESLPAWLAIIK